MEPRDDFDRAGASLRERAADLARGHDADEVTRLARRRRTWQGATAGLAVLAIVGVSVAALDRDLVDRIAVEPLAPSETEPSDSREEGADAQPTNDTDPTTTVCDAGEVVEPPVEASAVGDAVVAHPAAVAGAHLLSVGATTYALSRDAPVAFASLTTSGGWRCLPAPGLTGHLLAATAGDQVVAVSGDGAARFDAASDRWVDMGLPEVAGGRPVDAAWTGERLVVLFAGDRDQSPVLAFDPITEAWTTAPSLPFTVTPDTPTNLLSTAIGLVWVGGEPARDRLVWEAAHAVRRDASGDWVDLPPPPIADQHVTAALVDGDVVAVDGAGEAAVLDLEAGTWYPPTATGVRPGSCPPRLVASDAVGLLTACDQAAAFADGRWSTLAVTGSLTAAGVRDDGTALVWRRLDGGSQLLTLALDDADIVATADVGCGAIADFGARLVDTGIMADEAAPTTPGELADDVDLVVAGTLTGEVEVANGPGPAGESYLAYELEVTEVVAGDTAAGDTAAGDTLRVSIAFDGDPTRSAELAADVPVGASALVFAYEVTDAPGGWVAAEGNGFAVACDGGPPLGQVGDGSAWSDLADLDALADAARR